MDEKLNTYLIEVNTNPCLEESNYLLKRLLPRMLDDMLNLMVDPLFNYYHLYKDQLKTVNTDPRTDYLISNQNYDKFQAMLPNFNVETAKMPYSSNYSLPGSLFAEGHPGYSNNQNLWE